MGEAFVNVKIMHSVIQVTYLSTKAVCDSTSQTQIFIDKHSCDMFQTKLDFRAWEEFLNFVFGCLSFVGLINWVNSVTTTL